MSKPADALAGMSFEQALAELEGIVRRLESGEANLEQSIEDYARGTELKGHCQKKLEEARLKVEKLSRGAQGEITIEPFEAT